MGTESGSNYEPSNRKRLQKVYNEVNEVTAPGDVVFFVSKRKENQSLAMLRKLYRKWHGFVDEDKTDWHTSMFTEAKKESKGAHKRPYIIHAAEKKGVTEIRLPPAFFRNDRDKNGSIIQQARIEIIQNPDIPPEQRTEMVRYAREQLGKPFADLNWKQDILTYALGLPAQKLDPAKASCHGLVFDAYEHVGYSFSHQLNDAPWFNIGKHLGHPIGEDPDKANLRRLYLHDQHLYRDPRFICVLSIFQDTESGELTTQENPGKYSWDPVLQQAYGI